MLAGLYGPNLVGMMGQYNNATIWSDKNTMSSDGIPGIASECNLITKRKSEEKITLSQYHPFAGYGHGFYADVGLW